MSSYVEEEEKARFPSFSLFPEHAPVVRGNRPTGEEEEAVSSLVAITQFPPLVHFFFSFFMR
jgi:hypothetical protein